MLTTMPMRLLGVRYREHGDKEPTVILCADAHEQAAELGDLLTCQGIRGEPVAISYEPDAVAAAEVWKGLVADAIAALVAEVTDVARVMEQTRLLSPDLSDDAAGISRCSRVFWIYQALNAQRQFAEAQRDPKLIVPFGESENTAHRDYEEAQAVLAGVRAHGPGGSECVECAARKAAEAAGTAQDGGQS